MGFEAVDQSTVPGDLVDYLAWADRHRAVRAYKDHALDTLAAHVSLAGRRVLDVGCGRGRDLVALLERVGPAGQVLGVDRSALMLAEARRLAPGAALHQGDAAALPVADASVDVVRVDRVLVHVADPVAVVAECVRVLRPGGWLLLLEGDLAAVQLSHPDRATTARVVEQLARPARHPSVGRRLGALVAAAGLERVADAPHDLCFWTVGEAERFLLLEEAAGRAVAAGALSLIRALGWRLALETPDHGGPVAVLPGRGVLGRKP